MRPEELGFVDSAEGHVRCHWADAKDEERCGDVVVWAEQAWAAQVDGLGFTAPLPDAGEGGSDALDIYVTREAGGAGSAYVDCDGGDPTCVDPVPDDGIDGAPSYVVIDPRTANEDFPLFVFHEFQHTTQYARDFREPYLSLWEGTAVASEHWTNPGWPTSVEDFGDYQATPWLSTILQDGYFLADIGYSDDSWYEYGAVAWVFFLDDRYGDGAGSIGPELWRLAGAPDSDVLDAWETISGDREASLLEFAADRARMGTSAGPAYASFAGVYGTAWREQLADDGPSVPAYPPYPLGMSLYDATGSGTLTFAGDEDVQWAVLVVTDTDVTEMDAAELSATSGDGAQIEIDGDFTIVVVNLGRVGFTTADPLEPASFQVTWTGAVPETGCGCAATSAGEGAGVGLLGAWLAFACARRRRT